MEQNVPRRYHLPKLLLVIGGVLVVATFLSFFILFMQARQQEHFVSGQVTTVGTSTVTITSARGEQTIITITPHTFFLQGGGIADLQPGQEIMSRGNFTAKERFVADGIRLLRH